MSAHRVRYLLMGGQACVFYGAAEFSRDADLAVLADDENLELFGRALEGLQAERVAVPPFERRYLDMGLAVHFRCQHPDAKGVRVDVMSKMRGVDGFQELWSRRTTLDVDGERIELLSLPDLVLAKKTQRDKDWPMVARLLEANYFANQAEPTGEQMRFWLRELRTPTLLIDLASRFPLEAEETAYTRPLLLLAAAGDSEALRAALRAEEDEEREVDRQHWVPLRAELERLRRDHARRG